MTARPRQPLTAALLVVAVSFLAAKGSIAQQADTVLATSFEAAEGYAASSLHGQDAWTVTGGEAIVVDNTSYAHSGSRGIQLSSDDGPLTVNHTAFSGSESGVGGVVYFDVFVKVNALDGNALTLLGYDLFGGSLKRAFMIDFTSPSGASGTIRIYDGWEKTPIGSYEVDQWHRLSGQLDFDAARYQVSLDGNEPISVDFREDYTPTASGDREDGQKEYHQFRINFGEDDATGTVDAAIDDLYVGKEPPPDIAFTPLVVRHPVHVVQPSAGRIEIEPAAASFPEGTEVSVTLEPDAGFTGCGWLGVDGEGSKVSFTVDKPRVIGAEICPVETISERIVAVHSVAELEEALDEAHPGDVIEMADGDYANAGYVSVARGGVEDHPVTIRAASRGGVTFTGDSHFTFNQVAHVVLEGFVFATTGGTIVKTESSRHIRITRNVFRADESASGKWVLISGTHDLPEPMSGHNRIDHNLFEGKDEPGNFITIDGSPPPTALSSQHDRIDHNHFKDNGPRIENEKEAVRVGWSEMSMSSGFTVVESNLFENCDGDPEIVSVKTADNVVRFNTFRRSRGTLSLRHGDRTVVAGNFFFGDGKEGTGGIRLYGDDHLIYNNYFEGLTGTEWDAPIALTNGDADYGSTTDLTRHFRPRRIEIVHNTLVGNRHGIEVGYTGSGYNKPPADVTIANNVVVGDENALVHIFTQPETADWAGNLMYPMGDAVLGVTMSDDAIHVEDPQLTLQGELWRLSQDSPAIDGATETFAYVATDFDGQSRTNPDIGADEYAASSRIIRPLTETDVGPDAPDSAYDVSRTPEPSARGQTWSLKPPFPNPSRGPVRVPVAIASPVSIRLAVYDVLGRRVGLLANRTLATGTYEFVWEANAAPGVYFIRLESRGLVRSAAIVVAR